MIDPSLLLPLALIAVGYLAALVAVCGTRILADVESPAPIRHAKVSERRRRLRAGALSELRGRVVEALTATRRLHVVDAEAFCRHLDEPGRVPFAECIEHAGEPVLEAYAAEVDRLKAAGAELALRLERSTLVPVVELAETLESLRKTTEQGDAVRGELELVERAGAQADAILRTIATELCPPAGSESRPAITGRKSA